MRLSPLHCLLLPLLALMPMDNPAATPFRCEAADGRVSFHQHGCPPGQAQSRQRAHNPTPGSGRPVACASQPPNHQKAMRTASSKPSRAMRRIISGACVAVCCGWRSG